MRPLLAESTAGLAAGLVLTKRANGRTSWSFSKWRRVRSDALAPHVKTRPAHATWRITERARLMELDVARRRMRDFGRSPQHHITRAHPFVRQRT